MPLYFKISAATRHGDNVADVMLPRKTWRLAVFAALERSPFFHNLVLKNTSSLLQHFWRPVTSRSVRVSLSWLLSCVVLSSNSFLWWRIQIISWRSLLSWAWSSPLAAEMTSDGINVSSPEQEFCWQKWLAPRDLGHVRTTVLVGQYPTDTSSWKRRVDWEKWHGVLFYRGHEAPHSQRGWHRTE